MDDMSKELEVERAVERALRRALNSFTANYGTTSVRIELNPNTGMFDPETGEAGGGSVLLEWPGELKPGTRDKAYPLTVNVDFDVDKDFPGLASDTIEDAFLQYEWGDIGHRAQVDLTRGHPVSVAGSKLVIRAFYPRVVSEDPEEPITQPKIILRASLGIGAEGSAPGITGSARRTIRYGTVGPGNGLSNILSIPRWAVAAVLVNPSAAVSTLVFKQFLDAQANVLVSEVDLGKYNGISVPIAHGARFAQVMNPGGLAQVARIMYFLAVGA